mgnify:CR=1 FL=1
MRIRDVSTAETPMAIRVPFFQKVKSQEGFILENQDGKLTDFRDMDIEDYLADMFVTPDQFVILSAPVPQNKIRQQLIEIQ